MDWRDDIPGRYPRANYEVNATWPHLESWLRMMNEDNRLNLNPDYQRAHVWTEAQQVSFVEYALRGGEGGQVLYWNAPGWMRGGEGPIELVDGKQRLQAVRKFIAGDLKVFGHRMEKPSDLGLYYSFRMKVCSLETRADVLRWYLAINAGGTPHTPEELDRVRALLAGEEA